jgi:hypothetical protein
LEHSLPTWALPLVLGANVDAWGHRENQIAFPKMRHTETLTNSEYIPRVKQLESQGALYFKVKVDAHNLGYEISYTLEEKPKEVQSSLQL